ncbi:unnamed protein product [Caenorhabditis nigoni]
MAFNEEGALEKLKIAVVEELKANNEKKFDEMSDRLQSIEESISKISKLIEGDQKSKDISEEKPIDESTALTNASFFQNTTNVAPEKSFLLKHVFNNVDWYQNDVIHSSEWEDHFNVNWRMLTLRRSMQYLGFFLCCDPIAPPEKWAIQIKVECKVIGRSQNAVIRAWERCHKTNEAQGISMFLEWEEMKHWYLVDGNLSVETKVTIIETSGFEKEKIREFDESQKDVSDVILVVGDTKFYASKMFLASQSSVFKALLFGNFSESKQSEVTLNGIHPDDFHHFLEVLYGESAIDDTTVENIAHLADMYDAPTAIRKCEEFLLKESKKTLKKKLEIATRYDLKKLEGRCTSGIANLEDIWCVLDTSDNSSTHQTLFGLLEMLIRVFVCFCRVVVELFKLIFGWK